MIEQSKVFQLLIICILAKSMCGKPLIKLHDQTEATEGGRLKRGYSHYGENDFGSSVHVSSGVLQYSSGDEHPIRLDSSSSPDTSLSHSDSLSSGIHLESSAGSADPWTASGSSPGLDVWLEPLPDYHGTSALDAPNSIASTHPDSGHGVNTIFSHDSTHSAHNEFARSPLHTTVGSSSVGTSALDFGGSVHEPGSLPISDNIDFSNDADIKTKHYAKSYGK